MYQDSFKTNGNKATIWCCNLTPWHIPWENCNWKSLMYPSVLCSTMYNSQDMQSTLKSIERWMGKEVVISQSIQSLSCVWLFVTPWTAASQASLPNRNSQSLLKLMSIELVMPSNRLNLCHPLLLLPSIFPSIRVFSNESVLCIRWPRYWSFSFSISPSNEYPVRIDWLDLLAVQGTLKSNLQHHSSKPSILWC